MKGTLIFSLGFFLGTSLMGILTYAQEKNDNFEIKEINLEDTNTIKKIEKNKIIRSNNLIILNEITKNDNNNIDIIDTPIIEPEE